MEIASLMTAGVSLAVVILRLVLVYHQKKSAPGAGRETTVVSLTVKIDKKKTRS